MRLQVKKIHFVCLTLIFIQNLHMIYADSIFYDLATRMTAAVSRVYRSNEEYDLPNKQNNVDVATTPVEMIKKENYPAEIHNVTTEDGYILTLHRIPGPPGSIPVVIQHGLIESSADWLIPGKGKSLAYILSDYGYDVWLGNARGNTYSKKHKTLSTSDPQFWDFSWHELGVYDLSAVITYISELKRDSLFYIGHSMAATTFSVMAIEKPEIAHNVKAMISLAPATYVYHMTAPIRLLSPFWREIQRLSYALGIYEYFPRSTFFDFFAKYVCKSSMLRYIFCSNALFLIGGFNSEQLNYSLLQEIWSKFPAGTSTKLFIHWLQQMTVNEFRKFDYGMETNIKIYNSTVPPNYDLSKVRVPIAVFWSENDWLVGPEDAENFYNNIPLKLGIYKVENDKFNHFDFLWAIDAPKLVYSKVLDLMAEYNNQIIRK